MSDQLQNDCVTTTESEENVKPDYRFWGQLREAKKSFLSSILEFLRPRALHEIAVMIAMVEIYLVTRDIIKTSGNGLFTPLPFTCTMVCVTMIFILAMTIYLTSYARSRSDAETIRGREKAT
jgi:hypothetical protein